MRGLEQILQNGWSSNEERNRWLAIMNDEIMTFRVSIMWDSTSETLQQEEDKPHTPVQIANNFIEYGQVT